MAGASGSWRPPRSCEDYWDEWKHCRGLPHAFYHYYAHGELPDCGRWREDYEACRAWERDRAAAAQAKVIPGASRNAPGYSPADTGGHEPCSTGYSGTPPSRTAPGGDGSAEVEALCKSERARVMEKQKYAPVWELRKSPPPDWYLPLDHDKSN